MTNIKLTNITMELKGRRLLSNVSTEIKSGELIALIGPNGAGKTTLLKCALGLISPTIGTVTVDGSPIEDLSPIARAQKISYLPQMRPLAWPIRVRDVVALGRYAYGGSTTKLTQLDEAAVAKAISDCDLSAFEDRGTDTLSGGELARVHCARAFAAQAPLLLADEPVAALDLAHQFQIMSLIRNYVDHGGGAIVVLHDISLAARYADRLIWMKDSIINADGTPDETMTAGLMEKVFAVDATISKDEGGWSLNVSNAT